MLKKVAFTLYPVKDLARARTFYEKMLKLAPGKESGGGKWVEYDLPGGGCFSITSMPIGVEPSASAGGSIAFEVDDIDKLMAELKSKQIRIKMDIFDTPVCRMAVILDSEGNAVILHKLGKK